MAEAAHCFLAFSQIFFAFSLIFLVVVVAIGWLRRREIDRQEQEDDEHFENLFEDNEK